jgi:hypothetical protein
VCYTMAGAIMMSGVDICGILLVCNCKNLIYLHYFLGIVFALSSDFALVLSLRHGPVRDGN